MNLTDLHRGVAARLFAGESVTQIAKDLGKNRRTIELWRKDPDFLEYYEKLRTESEKKTIAETLNRLEALRIKALNRIDEILDSKDVSPRTWLSAAALVLKHCDKVDEQTLVQRGQQQAQKAAVFMANRRFESLIDQLLADFVRTGEISTEIAEFDPSVIPAARKLYLQAITENQNVVRYELNREVRSFYGRLVTEMEKAEYDEVRETLFKIFYIATGSDDETKD